MPRDSARGFSQSSASRCWQFFRPGAPWRYKERPGEARSAQDRPGALRSATNRPGAPKSAQRNVALGVGQNFSFPKTKCRFRNHWKTLSDHFFGPDLKKKKIMFFFPIVLLPNCWKWRGPPTRMSTFPFAKHRKHPKTQAVVKVLGFRPLPHQHLLRVSSKKVKTSHAKCKVLIF